MPVFETNPSHVVAAAEAEPIGRPDLQRLLTEFERRFCKNGVRFAVREPTGRHSSVWSALGDKNDYYIGVRSLMGGSTKISLHKSRVCKLGLTKEHFEFAVERGLIPPGEDKAFVQWRRPPAPDTGAELVVVLVFPTDFLRSDALTVTVKKPLVIFEAAAQARAVEIGFFYSREAGITLEPKLLEFGKPLFWTELDNGETVWMVSRDADFDPSVLPSTEEINSGAERLLNPDAFAEVSVEERGLTGAFWTPPKDGEALRVIEIGGISMKRNK
jgi:hypothetical protein